MKNISSLLAWGILFGAITGFAANSPGDAVIRKGKKGKIELPEVVETETVTNSKSKLLSKQNAILKAQAQAAASKELLQQAINRKTLNSLHPVTRMKLNAALEDIEDSGVAPRITSGYRSKAQQHSIYQCAQVYTCKMHRGIFGANKPGASLHEAGLAVDLADVAHGKRHRRQLTRDGKQVVKIMQRHGFNWKYGLGDPAHFEIDPKVAGFKNQEAAIAAAERRLRKTMRH
jgi:LAS superfamily LD-carboxypeptidase LdcB